MASGAFVTLDRQFLYNRFEDGLQYTVNEALKKDNHYTLFRSEDWLAWVTFTAVFFGLLTFDNVVMSNSRTMTIKTAVLYTLFWVFCACCFCGWVYAYYGPSQAFMWMS